MMSNFKPFVDHSFDVLRRCIGEL